MNPALVEGDGARYFLCMADPARVLEQALELRARIRPGGKIGRRIDEVEAGSAELEDWAQTDERLQRSFSR